MHVAVIQVELRIPEVHSLKERRRIILPLKHRLRRRFEVAVSDVGSQDVWQSAMLGIALVTQGAREARERADRILEHLESDHAFEVVDSEVEVLG